MGPIWDRQDPGGLHVGPMNFAIWDVVHKNRLMLSGQNYKMYIKVNPHNLHSLAMCEYTMVLSLWEIKKLAWKYYII